MFAKAFLRWAIEILINRSTTIQNRKYIWKVKEAHRDLGAFNGNRYYLQTDLALVDVGFGLKQILLIRSQEFQNLWNDLNEEEQKKVAFIRLATNE